jgi:hypothetical protein
MSARQRFPTEVMIGRDQLLLRVKLPGVSCRRCGSNDRFPAVGRSPSHTAREELRAPGIGRKAQQGSRLTPQKPRGLGTGNWGGVTFTVTQDGGSPLTTSRGTSLRNLLLA